MNTMTIIADFGGPKRVSTFPPDFTGNEEKMIDERQRKMLTELILAKSTDEKEAELFLSQIDSMNSDDAEDLIFSLLSNRW
jgi:hypothetical protein